jgi:ribose-phosphate pyrophosphokinase
MTSTASELRSSRLGAGSKMSGVVQSRLAVFSLHSGQAFAERVVNHLGTRLMTHEEREFEWGQHKTRPLESVRDADVYVVQSLHGQPGSSVNDTLCRLLFFLAALRDAGSRRTTAVVPYLGYSRKDRQTQHRDPVTTRYVAALFEAMGVDRVVTLEVHNLAAFQNAFRCRTEHLGARRILADAIVNQFADRELVVVSPDLGGIKRANSFRDALTQRLGRPVPTGFIEKRRSDDVVTGDLVVGDMKGRTAVLVDDMISGGTTLARAADACRRAGAVAVVAVAAHGAFVPDASQVLSRAPLDRIIVFDHIPPATLDEAVAAKLVVLESAPLFAEAIRRLHYGHPLGDLLDP